MAPSRCSIQPRCSVGSFLGGGFIAGIAIVTLIPYNWFHSLVASLQHDIETAANNVEVFTAQKK